jgi:hypothetical protein
MGLEAHERAVYIEEQCESLGVGEDVCQDVTTDYMFIFWCKGK